MKKKIIIGIIVTVLLLVGGICFYLYQFSEVFGEKIVPVKINSVSIYYVPGYSLDEANLLNNEKEVVEKQEIKLSKQEIKEIAKYFRQLKAKEKQATKNNELLYEVYINKTTLDVSEKDGLVTRKKKKTVVKISQELYDYIEALVNNKQDKLLKTYEYEEASYNYNKTTISIKSNANLIKDQLIFYPIKLDEDFKTYNGGYKMVLTVNKNIIIYLYDNKVAYINDKREETEDNYYAICVNRLYEILDKIYEKSTS